MSLPFNSLKAINYQGILKRIYYYHIFIREPPGSGDVTPIITSSSKDRISGLDSAPAMVKQRKSDNLSYTI